MIVSIESPPGGYSYVQPGQPVDSDTTTSGQQRAATITNGVSDLDNDFGYHATTTSYALSGVLWNDNGNAGGTANDGIRNGSEPGISGVTVELLQGGTVIGMTTTAADGSYGFAGLPAGSYTVRITDSGGVLNGYATTFEKTEGAKAVSYN